MNQEEIKIPKDRIPILIGKNGSTRKKIETKSKTKIEVNSETGDVTIKSEDAINCFNTLHVIKAIARGFNPEISLTLLNEENSLEILNIQDYTGKSKKNQMRIKSRAIGSQGKAKEMIEQLTNTQISIYGKTISVIGKVEDVLIARKALESLLNGAPHGNVYRNIEDLKKNKYL